MQSRRDQVQAYRFAQTRMQSALVAGDTDQLTMPLRRAGVSSFAGVMVGILLLAAVGVIGLVNPSGKKGWSDAGVLVVEKETGARYVYDPGDQALHPVPNYTSARLLLDRADVSIRRFSSSSLAGVPRGRAMGIAGLPDSLPGASALVQGPWLTCSGRAGATDVPSITISGGQPPSGRALTGDQAVLVRVSSGDFYLLWNNTRLKVIDLGTLSGAFGWTAADAIPVPDAWINAVAPGPDLAPPHLPGTARKLPYPTAEGNPVYLGQIFLVPAQAGQPERYLIAVDDGLAPISTFVAQLLLADPFERQAYDNGSGTPTAFSTNSTYLSQHTSSQQVTPAGLPADILTLARPSSLPTGASTAICAAYQDRTGTTLVSQLYLGGTGAGSWQQPLQPAGTGQLQVVLPPGRGALIRPLAHAGQDSGSAFLLTDDGIKYPVPSAHTQQVLGYQGVPRVPLPAGVAGLIPTGPSLNLAPPGAAPSIPAVT